jgi:hypothetical protein
MEIEPCGGKGDCCYGGWLLEECGCRRRSGLGDWDANTLTYIYIGNGDRCKIIAQGPSI